MVSSGLAVVCSSALCSDTGIGLSASVYDGFADSVGRGWDAADADSSRVVNGVQDGGSGWDHGLFADTFCAERADRGRVFDEDGFDGWDIADRGDEVVVQVLAFAGEKFFHECHAQALGYAALDLAFDETGVDSAAYVVGGYYF